MALPEAQNQALRERLYLTFTRGAPQHRIIKADPYIEELKLPRAPLRELPPGVKTTERPPEGGILYADNALAFGTIMRMVWGTFPFQAEITRVVVMHDDPAWGNQIMRVDFHSGPLPFGFDPGPGTPLFSPLPEITLPPAARPLILKPSRISQYPITSISVWWFNTAAIGICTYTIWIEATEIMAD